MLLFFFVFVFVFFFFFFFIFLLFWQFVKKNNIGFSTLCKQTQTFPPLCKNIYNLILAISIMNSISEKWRFGFLFIFFIQFAYIPFFLFVFFLLISLIFIFYYSSTL